MQGIPNHLTADKQQQQKSNPVVIAGNVPGKTATQHPPQKRHQRLKAAEKQGNDEHMPVVDPSHSKPLADRYCKSIHRKPHTDQQQLQIGHIITSLHVRRNASNLTILPQPKPSVKLIPQQKINDAKPACRSRCVISIEIPCSSVYSGRKKRTALFF